MSCVHRHLQKFLFCSLPFFLLFAVLPTTVYAETDSWQFQIAPYAWLAGMDGKVSTLPGLPPADIDLDFWDDIVENIDGTLMIVGEARKGNFGLFADVAYVDLEQDATTPGSYFSSVEVTTKNWIVSAAAFYRMLEDPGLFLDILAGVRYWSVENTLELRSGLLPGREVTNKEDWVDPLVGLKGYVLLGASKFFVSGGLAIGGGIGSGSDSMLDMNANLGYQWGKMFSTTLGYRYLEVDYEDDGFLYDISQQGPVIGLSWRF